MPFLLTKFACFNISAKLKSIITKSLISRVWILLIFLISSSSAVFLTTSYFTTLLTLLKSIAIVSHIYFLNLTASNLKLAKSVFLANYDASRPLAFLNQLFLLETDLIPVLYCSYYDYMVLENNSFHTTISFWTMQLLKKPFHLTYNFFLSFFSLLLLLS